MRGKANVPVTCPTLIGITPAYAGKSQVQDAPYIYI